MVTTPYATEAARDEAGPARSSVPDQMERSDGSLICAHEVGWSGAGRVVAKGACGDERFYELSVCDERAKLYRGGEKGALEMTQ